ncbi:MAG TPA: hypothetical protein VHZ95_11295 [Polyangiales bacterium]|jgi:hypothetical protein|nr:hypothetical protein [Polyangiales bacterium]
MPAADGGSVDAGKSGANGTAGTSGGAGGTSDAVDAGICTYVPGNDPDNCPDDLPQNCPDPAPSYGSEVSTLISSYCVPCHRAGGLAADRQFGTYAVVFKDRIDMLSRLAKCEMPPSCAAQPTATERAALLSWLVCNAPNN